jgi:hypothetical protein
MGGFLGPKKIILKGFGVRGRVSYVGQVHARDTGEEAD